MKVLEAIRNKKDIVIFDVDDTLVVTRSMIKVSNPATGFSTELTPH